MVYRKQLNKRSPLRVFERSLHGGLGKGNIGVVTSRKGVGKTAFEIAAAMVLSFGFATAATFAYNLVRGRVRGGGCGDPAWMHG